MPLLLSVFGADADGPVLLVVISGIDASGKQGIFPSNYVSARSDKSREAPCTDSAPSNPNAGGGCAVAWPASIGSCGMEKQLEPGRTRRRWAMCYVEEGSTVGPSASAGHTDVLQTRNAFICNFFVLRRRAGERYLIYSFLPIPWEVDGIYGRRGAHQSAYGPQKDVLMRG